MPHLAPHPPATAISAHPRWSDKRVGQTPNFLSSRNQAYALCTSALMTPEAGRQAEYPAAYLFIARAVAIHKCKLALVAFAKARHRPQVTARDPASATSELGFRPGFPETPDSYNPPGAPMAAPLPRACGGAFFFRGAA
jgi:hypothetical protein